jgi:hypothetical protein
LVPSPEDRGIFLIIHMAEKPYRKGILNSLESQGMGTCLITLYAGLLFFNRYLTSAAVILVTEIIVLTVNLGFIVTCILQLALEYALSVSQNKNYIRFVISLHKNLRKIYTFSEATNKKVEALQLKLKDNVLMSVDEMMILNKFRRNSKVMLAGKVKTSMKNSDGGRSGSKVKVVPNHNVLRRKKSNTIRLY